MEQSIRDWLMQSRELDEEINALMLAREAALERCLGGSAAENAPTGGRRRTHNAAMEAYAELTEKLDRRIDRLCDLRMRILDVIALVPESRMRAVLTERYVCCYTWETIAEHINTETRTVYRLHNSAIKSLTNETLRRGIRIAEPV